MKACHLWVLSVGVVACVAPEKNIGLESDTEGASGSGDVSGDPSGETDSVGPDLPSGCSTIGDAEACNATTDCAWVEITTIQGSGDFCGFDQPRSECISTFYQGEGCEVSPACGVDGSPMAYWASRPDLGQDAFDIISSHAFCENQPSGFASCRWDGGALLDGPDACSCICEGGGQALPPGVENELSDRFGCSDVFLYAVNAASTLALTVSIDGGYAMQANDTEAPVDIELTAGDDAEVQFHIGSDLASAFCTDVGGVGQIDATWTAVSGSVTLHVEPGKAPNAAATATLTDVELVGDDPEYAPYTIESFYFEDIQVGWLPG